MGGPGGALSPWPENNCPGHFGRIVLPHPILNPLFVGLIVSVLQTLCVNCHRLRLSPHYINTMLPPVSHRSGLRLLRSHPSPERGACHNA